MPEGPEVRHRGDILNEKLSGKLLICMESSEKSRYKNQKQVLNQKVCRVTTKGKVTFIELEKLIIKIHYAMEGNLVFEKGQHSDLWFIFDDSCTVWFNDTRHFGTVEILTKEEFQKAEKKIGPDLFKISKDDFVTNYKKFPKKEICQVMMDQDVVSGIGNYLKAEILFASKIYPGALISDLTKENLETIFDQTQKIANESYRCHGCSLKTYKDCLGNPGTFELKIYNHPLCHKREFKDKRTTHWSPTVQVIGCKT